MANSIYKTHPQGTMVLFSSKQISSPRYDDEYNYMTPRRRVSDHRGNRELKLVPTPVLVQWSFQAKVARLLHNSWIDYRSAVVEFPSNSALLIHQITLRFLPFRLLPVPFIPLGWVIPLGKARGTVRLLSVFSNQGHSRSLWRSNAEPSPILTSPAH